MRLWERRSTGILRRMIYRLGSLKIGAILVLHLTALLILVAFSPSDNETGFSKEWARLSIVENLPDPSSLSFQPHVESTTFLLLLLSLSLSIALSLYIRVKGELKRARSTRIPRGIQEIRNPAIEHITAELKKSGYRVVSNGTGQQTNLRAEKGRAGVWGSVLFHASILVLLMGVGLSKFGSLEASIALTEGQTFDAELDAFGVEEIGPLYFSTVPAYSFQLIRIDPRYEVNGAHTMAAIIAAPTDGVARQVPVYINNGMTLQGSTIHIGAKTGYSPFVRVADSDGIVVHEGYLRLATFSAGGGETYRDFIELPSFGGQIEFEFDPGDAGRNHRAGSGVFTSEYPTLFARLTGNDESYADVLLSSGRGSRVGEYTIFFGDVRRWVQIDISDDPGLPVLMIGSLLASIGLAARLVGVRRKLVVHIRHADNALTLDVSGTTEKYQKTFEEELSLVRSRLADITIQMQRQQSGRRSRRTEGVTRRKEIHESIIQEEAA